MFDLCLRSPPPSTELFLDFSDFLGTFSGSGVGGSQTPLGRLFETFRVLGVFGSVDGGGDLKSVSFRPTQTGLCKLESVWSSLTFWHGGLGRDDWAPQTCVYPDVSLGIAHASGKAPLSGQGVW